MIFLNPNDFEPNSNKYRQEQEAQEIAPKIEKVVSGTSTKRKRGLFKRFSDIFLTEDVGDVRTYLLYEVLIPSIKENVADLINCAVGMMFFGEASRRTRRAGSPQNTSKVNYGSYFTGGEKREKMPSYSRSRIAHNFDDVVFETRNDAELVLDGMLEILNSECRQVTVADFYDLAGISSNFTDNKFGWVDLRTARVVGSPSRGYSIDLPKCEVLQ